jgi:hypothetical protein
MQETQEVKKPMRNTLQREREKQGEANKMDNWISQHVHLNELTAECGKGNYRRLPEMPRNSDPTRLTRSLDNSDLGCDLGNQGNWS